MSHHGRLVDLLKHRNLNDFNNNTVNIFNLLSISGKYQVIGSSLYKSILYNNDYDLQETDNETNYYELFKNKFIKAKKNNNVYITDFKCGEINGEPLRWTYHDMMKAYKIINKKKITFNDALLMKKMIKLDMICFIGGRFLEFSDNYYIKINGKNMYEELNHDTILKNLIESAENEYKEGNYYKYLKRVYSILIMKQDKTNMLMNLTYFFNSINGFFYKQVSDLKIIKLILENNFRKPDYIHIIDNLQFIKQNLCIFSDDLSESIDNICRLCSSKEPVIHILDKIINTLLKTINENAFQYIKNEKINLH